MIMRMRMTTVPCALLGSQMDPEKYDVCSYKLISSVAIPSLFLMTS